jgi:hypothetical protein
VTRIHISHASKRVARKDGDQKIIKGVLCERISKRTLIMCWDDVKLEPCYRAAWDFTGGRQCHEWVPVTELVGQSPHKRRCYEQIDGKRKKKKK